MFLAHPSYLLKVKFHCVVHRQADKQWLIDVLWKKKAKGNRNLDIEVEDGFRLFIHQRDFIAGRTIMANIRDGIEKSRRVIFILSRFVEKEPNLPLLHFACFHSHLLKMDLCSRNFLKSKWGMEEFMIADHEAVNGRKNFIIPILTEKLEIKGLRREVKTYLQTHTYIDGIKHREQVSKRLR